MSLDLTLELGRAREVTSIIHNQQCFALKTTDRAAQAISEINLCSLSFEMPIEAGKEVCITGEESIKRLNALRKVSPDHRFVLALFNKYRQVEELVTAILGRIVPKRCSIVHFDGTIFANTNTKVEHTWCMVKDENGGWVFDMFPLSEPRDIESYVAVLPELQNRTQ